MNRLLHNVFLVCLSGAFLGVVLPHVCNQPASASGSSSNGLYLTNLGYINVSGLGLGSYQGGPTLSAFRVSDGDRWNALFGNNTYRTNKFWKLGVSNNGDFELVDPEGNDGWLLSTNGLFVVQSFKSFARAEVGSLLVSENIILSGGNLIGQGNTSVSNCILYSSGTRVPSFVRVSTLLNFDTILLATESQDVTVTLMGALPDSSQTLSLGSPSDTPRNSIFSAFISAPNTITIRRQALVTATAYTNRNWSVTLEK